MTRDPARIDLILADLRRYWHAAPDLRLGQMVMGLLDLSGAPRYGEFNAEDDKVAAYLAAWAAANPPPPDHRDTLPPEIEAAIAAAAWTVAELDRRADVMAQPEIADLRTAITSAIAAAHEAGRREVLEGAAGVEEAIEAWGKAAICGYAAQGTIAAERKRSAIRAAIAAAIDHAAKGMRPVLSQADAAKLIDAYGVDAALHGALGATGDARAALLASLTGADAPNPTQCGAVDMLRGTICPTCGAREEFAPGPPTGEIRRQMDAAAVEICAECTAALTGAGGGR